jgi:phage head maturation protease
VLRTITKISKLYDVSAVSIPANDATSISARNYGEGVIAGIEEERLVREKRERQKQKIRILLEAK